MEQEYGTGRVKVLFLGNNYNPFSVACLQSLLAPGSYTVIVGIYDPKGASTWTTMRKYYAERGLLFLFKRGLDLLISSLRLGLRRLGFPLRGFRSMQELVAVYKSEFFWCEKLSSPESLELLKSISPDLIVVANFTQILKPPVIEIPRLGCINVHPSLLPKYRGPSPFYWVLKNHERKTGVTIHYIDPGIDTGDIIGQREVPIKEADTEFTLRKRSACVASQLLPEVVESIKAGSAPRIRQNDDEATYYSFPPRGKSLL